MTFYPLTQILLYLALFFAPPDATHITVTGPGISIGLARDKTGWTDGGARLSAADGQLTREENSDRETTPVADRVKAALGNDWTLAPKITLHDATTLEKTAAGFVFRINEGDSAMRLYTIAYVRPPTASAPVASPAPITVNVLGCVHRPGSYPLSAGATLLDAFAAAGGGISVANTNKLSVVRGPAGEIPVVLLFDAAAILRGQAPNPPLLDHDTLYVPERIL